MADTTATPQTNKPAWLHNAVGYEVYVRSFADSTGNGIGDLMGITERLEYLAWLGIDIVWITPCYPSPMADHGYDVADYVDIEPIFGDLDAMHELIDRAHQLGLRVVLDIVPNHSSDQHLWFRAASRGSDRSLPRLLPLARPSARWRAAQQLGRTLRRPSLDTRRSERTVLLPPVSARTTRPQLAQSRAASRIRADSRVLVRARRRRLSHRCRACSDQGQRVPRQPPDRRSCRNYAPPRAVSVLRASIRSATA